MKVIIPVNLTRPSNKIHTSFHDDIMWLIQKTGEEHLPFAALLPKYTTALANEKEALLIFSNSMYTPQILEQDKLRNNIFRGFSDAVNGFRKHFDPEYRSAANRLWKLFQHYGNVTRQTYDGKTAAINDMVNEFKRPEIHTAVEMLRISNWLEQLGYENDKFQKLMMARYHESTTKTIYRMKTARVETNNIFRAIVAIIESQAMIGNVSPELQKFIAELNSVITHYNNTLAQDEGRRKKVISV